MFNVAIRPTTACSLLAWVVFPVNGRSISDRVITSLCPANGRWAAQPIHVLNPGLTHRASQPYHPIMRTALFSFIILVWISAWASPSDAAPRQGRLSIDSFTPGAQIFVDGKLRGVTPLKTPLKLMVGRRTVRVSKLGYGDFIDTVRIYRGRQQSLTVDLIPVAGVLRVESDPGGADVILNGRILGTTPFKGAVEPGQHSLELNLPNHLMHRRSIFIQVGEEAFVRQTLLYRPGGVVDNERPWYRNHWIWVGAAGLVLVSAVITAVALSADDDPNTNDVNPLTIETVR